MGRTTFLQSLLLLLIILDGYNASFGWEHRKLAASDPNKNKPPVQGTPTPTPVLLEKNADLKPNSETKKNEADPASTNNSPEVDPKNLNPAVSPAFPPIANTAHETPDPKGSNSNNPTPASPTPETKRNNEKGHEKEKENGEGKNKKKEKEKGEMKTNENKNEGKTIQQSNTDKSCDGSLRICNDNSKMVGCIFETGSAILVFLVQNGEESAINVNISSVESHIGDAEVAKHQTAMINITLSGITNLTLNAGHGDCDLQTDAPTPKGKSFVRLPSYEKVLTPVNGAYFLIVSVIVFGGTWACCKCRTKTRHDGNQYQELEMALPESAANVETADGWDESWDDDWDEDMAVKSPGKHVGSISANGLTSRSSNKDGWENNWDD